MGIHVSKEKLANIGSGVTLDDDITENTLNVVDVGKSRRKGFTQKELISKEISFHAPISFYVVRNIRLNKKDGKVKVEELNRTISGILNSYIIKTGKPVDFKKTLLCALFLVHLSISNPDECRRDTAKTKLNDILMQDLENHTCEVSSRIQIYCRHDSINKCDP